MLRINLQSLYGDFKLELKQVIPTDCIVGLFGSSGSGKSRFIRQLLGFDKDQQHICKIDFNNQNWQNSEQNKYFPAQQRGIGYLPQSVDLFPHLSVLDNIYFGLNKRHDKPDKKLIDRVLSQLDLTLQLEKYPHQLSGGQKQRVGLARAILAARKLLLIDEPLSAIGEDHKPFVMQLLRMINREYRLPIIFSSHNRVEHAFLSDYLLTFEQGKIRQSGEYDKIAMDIEGHFAQMSDAINHIDAEVVNFNSDCSVNQLKTKQHQLWAGYQPIKSSTKVKLEVRAQDISLFLSREDRSSMLNCLNVKIAGFQEISRHQFLIKLAFEDLFLIAFITKKSFLELELKMGQQLYARFKAVSVLPISLKNRDHITSINTINNECT